MSIEGDLESGESPILVFCLSEEELLIPVKYSDQK